MRYDRLARHFARFDWPTVTTLPDGSIDYYYSITGGTGDLLDTRDALAHELLSDRTSIEFTNETTEPGGQAVNAVKQLHALSRAFPIAQNLETRLQESPAFDRLDIVGLFRRRRTTVGNLDMRAPSLARTYL